MCYSNDKIWLDFSVLILKKERNVIVFWREIDLSMSASKQSFYFSFETTILKQVVQNFIIDNLVKNFQVLEESGVLLMCLWNPATEPYCELCFSRHCKNLDFLQLCLCFISRIVIRCCEFRTLAFVLQCFAWEETRCMVWRKPFPLLPPPHTHTPHEWYQNIYRIRIV